MKGTLNFSYYYRFLARTLVIIGLLMPTVSVAVEVNQHPVLVKLVAQMIAEDGYPEDELNRVLQQAKIKQKIIDLISKQYEAQPWYRYKHRLLNEKRVRRGVKFWQENNATLKRAHEQFGIPQAVIVALIGIETNYGSYMGSDRVLDALVTLSAKYPQRSRFFTAELRTFLNMTRQEKINPTSVLGSYAGAIGMPQFMPSSYVAYAVDFNGNAQRDLINEVDDVIGSVANYLKSHGWNNDQLIYAKVTKPLSKTAAKLVSRQLKLAHTQAQLIAAGVQFDAHRGSKNMMLFSLQEEQGSRQVVGFKNFYVITRYNHSINYAMVAVELAEAITRAKNKQK